MNTSAKPAKRSRQRSCGTCAGCTRENCGKCQPCKDKHEHGACCRGCIEKVCLHPPQTAVKRAKTAQVHATPAEVASKTAPAAESAPPTLDELLASVEEPVCESPGKDEDSHDQHDQALPATIEEAAVTLPAAVAVYPIQTTAFEAAPCCLNRPDEEPKHSCGRPMDLWQVKSSTAR